MIQYNDYLALLQGAAEAADIETLRAEYGYPGNCPYSADGVIIFCEIIWAVAHNDLKALVDISTCGNMSAFARLHNVPLRTVQDWIGGKRVPSEYIMQLLGYAVIGGIPEEE